MEKLGDNSFLETRTKERNRKQRRTIMVPTFSIQKKKMVPTFAKVYVFQCMLTIYLRWSFGQTFSCLYVLYWLNHYDHVQEIKTKDFK